MSNLQKIILIIGFILVVFAVGFLLYILFFRPFIPTENANSNVNGNAVLPLANGNANLRIITNVNGEFPLAGNINGNENINNAGIEAGQPTPTPTPTVVVTSLTENIAINPTLSPDGKSIYYYDSQNDKFYTVGADGKQTVCVMWNV